MGPDFVCNRILCTFIHHVFLTALRNYDTIFFVWDLKLYICMFLLPFFHSLFYDILTLSTVMVPITNKCCCNHISYSLGLLHHYSISAWTICSPLRFDLSTVSSSSLCLSEVNLMASLSFVLPAHRGHLVDCLWLLLRPNLKHCFIPFFPLKCNFINFFFMIDLLNVIIEK